jgi:hypothetical protein
VKFSATSSKPLSMSLRRGSELLLGAGMSTKNRFAKSKVTPVPSWLVKPLLINAFFVHRRLIRSTLTFKFGSK